MNVRLITFALALFWASSVFGQQKMVKEVETVAQLRLQNPNDIHKAIVVRGLASKGDGGGGIYFWESANTATEDGFEYVKANSTGSGRWVRGIGSRSIYVSDLNGDGQVSASEFQSGIDTAKTYGVRSVAVAQGNYTLTNVLKTWSGVRFWADGKVSLTRNHFLTGSTNTGSYTGERFMIQAYGGSSLSGFTLDDNQDGTVVSTNGVGAFNDVMDTQGRVNQTQYGCVAVVAGEFDYGPNGNTALTDLDDDEGNPGSAQVVIENCTFIDACGSAIKNHEAGARSVIVTQCKFGDYNDHAVYFTGWPSLSGTNVPAINIRVVDNDFSSPNQTRGNTAVKIRNYSSGVVVSQNTMYLTNDTFVTIDVGDSIGGSQRNGPITISENTGFANRFISSECGNVADAVQLNVNDNNVTVKTYLFHGSFNGSGGPSGTILVNGNTFRSMDESTAVLNILRGNTGASNINATTWVWKANTLSGIFTTYAFGWLTLDFSGNTLIDRRAPGAGNVSFFNPIANNALVASTTNVWTFRGNKLYNYGSLFFDNSDVSSSGGNHALVAANLIFDGNLLFGHPTRNWVLDYRGTDAGTYSGANGITLKENIFPTDQTSPSTTVSAAKMLDLRKSTPSGVDLGSEAVVISGISGVSRPLNLMTGLERRWVLQANSTAESGANAGSDFVLSYFDDDGVSLGTALTITRSTGDWIVNAPQFTITNPADGVTAGISAPSGLATLFIRGVVTNRLLAFQSGATNRWDIRVNNATETGSGNAGSDWQLNRYNDAGTIISPPVIHIPRATGIANFTNGVTASSFSTAGGILVPMYINGSGVTDSLGVNMLNDTWDVELVHGTGPSPDELEFRFLRVADPGTDPSLLANQVTIGDLGVVFEGATANGFEGELVAADVTADRVWTLPNQSGTVAMTSDIAAWVLVDGLASADGYTFSSTPFDITLTVSSGTTPDTVDVEFARDFGLGDDPTLLSGYATFAPTGVIFEGATANAFEGLLMSADATVDRTWTLKDRTGTLAIEANATTGMQVGSVSSDPSTPADGEIWHNTTDGLLKVRVPGQNTTVGLISSYTANIQTRSSKNLQVADALLAGGSALDTTENNKRILLDAAATETATWQFPLPFTYNASGNIEIFIYYSMNSATSGNVVWEAGITAVTPGDSEDINSATGSSSNQIQAVPGTAGYLDRVKITPTTDSASAGDYVRVNIARNGGNGSDTATGDAEVVAVEVVFPE